MSESETEGNEDWRKHKPYGSGLKRRKIDFIPAGSSAPASGSSTPKATAAEISQLYLSLVLPKGTEQPTNKLDTTPPKSDPSIKPRDLHSDLALRTLTDPHEPFSICNVCNFPIVDDANHPHTTAHQYSLPHSVPPHHYNRSSKGLRYLMDQGWDPDERVGLGAQGQGTKYPLKPEPKRDTYGIGIKRRGSSAPPAPPKKKLLDAKQASIMAEKDKKARRKLQEYLFS